MKYLIVLLFLYSCKTTEYNFSKYEKYDINPNKITLKYSVCTPNIKICVYRDSVELNGYKYKILNKVKGNKYLRLELEDENSLRFDFIKDEYYFFSSQYFYKFTK